MTDTYVLMAAESEAPALNPDDAQGGDWMLSVILELWEPVGDHNERLYSFNVGGLNFGGLDSKTRGKGLIDPAKVRYIRDGNYVGVLIDRSALSALEDVTQLKFVAEGDPQEYLDNEPMSDGSSTTGFTSQGSQWCPDEKGTIDVPSFP